MHVFEVTHQTTYAQMPAHVRVVEVDMLDFDSDRVRIFATALMPFEYAARMQPGDTREHKLGQSQQMY